MINQHLLSCVQFLSLKNQSNYYKILILKTIIFINSLILGLECNKNLLKLRRNISYRQNTIYNNNTTLKKSFPLKDDDQLFKHLSVVDNSRSLFVCPLFFVWFFKLEYANFLNLLL